MKKRKYLSVLAASLFLVTALSGCGTNTAETDNSPTEKPATSSQDAQPTDEASDVQTIHVGADTTFPPFESEKGGKVQGFDIDMINAIAEHEHLKVDLSTMQFTGLIPALQSGQIDVAVAGITIKKSRMEKANFSNAYYKSGLSVLTKADSGIKGIDDLKGKLVGTKKGTSSVDLLKEKGITNIKQYDNIDAAYSALESSGVEAVVFDNPVNLNFASSHDDVQVVGGLLTGEYYGIAINQDNPDLQKKINEGLKAIKESGEYKKLFDKYFGGDTNGMVTDEVSPASVAIDDTK